MSLIVISGTSLILTLLPVIPRFLSWVIVLTVRVADALGVGFPLPGEHAVVARVNVDDPILTCETNSGVPQPLDVEAVVSSRHWRHNGGWTEKSAVSAVRPLHRHAGPVPVRRARRGRLRSSRSGPNSTSRINRLSPGTVRSRSGTGGRIPGNVGTDPTRNNRRTRWDGQVRIEPPCVRPSNGQLGRPTRSLTRRGHPLGRQQPFVGDSPRPSLHCFSDRCGRTPTFISPPSLSIIGIPDGADPRVSAVWNPSLRRQRKSARIRRFRCYAL